MNVESDHSIEGRQYYYLERKLIATILKEGDRSLLKQPFATENRTITAEDAPELLCRPGLVKKEIYDSVSTKSAEKFLPTFDEWEEKMKELRQHYMHAKPVFEKPASILHNSIFSHSNPVFPSTPPSEFLSGNPSTGTDSPEIELSEDEHVDKPKAGL